jgi:hypothetical protein
MRLRSVSREIEKLEDERTALVNAARAERQSWRSIADALGVSRQAAWSAHRAAAGTVDAIRSRSDLTEDEAADLAAQALREAREQRGA